MFLRHPPTPAPGQSHQTLHSSAGCWHSDSAGTATVTEFTYDEGTSNTGNYIIENISGGFESGDEVTWDNSGTQESVTITGILFDMASRTTIPKVSPEVG